MRILSYLIIIFLTPTLILLNFRLLIFNYNFYQSQFTKLGVYQQFGSFDLVNFQSKNLINYLCCTGSLDLAFFTKRERLHLADVRVLIQFARLELSLMVILIAASSLLLSIHKKNNLLLFSFQWATIVSTLAMTSLWLISQLNFDRFFLDFHFLVFRNDLWQLPEGSNLIKLFPPDFFVNSANRIAFQVFGESIVIFVTIYLVRSKLAASRD